MATASNAALEASLAAAGLLSQPRVASQLLSPAVLAGLTVRPRVAFAGAPPVEHGTFFRAGACRAAPSLGFSSPEGGKEQEKQPATYLFMMVDPDAPSPDDYKFAYWRHWVVGGLRPGEGVEAAGRELTGYLGPGPKDDSKPHRYLFLLYREPAGGLAALERRDVGGEEFVERRSFAPVEFAERHGLVLVGVEWMTCAGDGWTAEEA